MRPFRFCGEAALQLRRRQHERALVHQASAERAVMEADRAVAAATETVRSADARLMHAAGASVDLSQRQWQVSWRVRCIRDRERLSAQRQERLIELQDARDRAGQAHRQVRSLERLRERAFLDWTQLAELEERKTMDALAVSQYVRRKDDR
jgi:hypothetical protein